MKVTRVPRWWWWFAYCWFVLCLAAPFCFVAYKALQFRWVGLAWYQWVGIAAFCLISMIVFGAVAIFVSVILPGLLTRVALWVLGRARTRPRGRV